MDKIDSNPKKKIELLVLWTLFAHLLPKLKELGTDINIRVNLKPDYQSEYLSL